MRVRVSTIAFSGWRDDPEDVVHAQSATGLFDLAITIAEPPIAAPASISMPGTWPISTSATAGGPESKTW